nr:hypothetical protein BaRGS_003814 [Batillaria attramentaria]
MGGEKGARVNTGSYIEKEEKRRADLGIDTSAAPLGLTDNSELLQKGQATASRYIKAYLRYLYPALYEEGICAIHDHLMSEDTLAFVARRIGISDLMLCGNVTRAEALVRDLVLAQLVGVDLSELWSVVNPMGLLMATLHAQGRGPPEPRLLWTAGKRTVMSVYHVGIYSDRRLIGQCSEDFG